jgi:hypothetical protein
MKEVLEAAGKRVGRRKGCLDASVVAALVKLWGWSEEGESIPEWEVGESGPPGFADGMAGVDAEIKGVLIADRGGKYRLLGCMEWGYSSAVGSS